MKRILSLAVAGVIILTPATALAFPEPQADITALFNLKLSEPTPPPLIITPKQSEPKKDYKPKPVVYVVKRGDNLTKIGSKHNVKWQRLWAKNKKLKHPDIIHIGDKIVIPLPGEKLKRAIPASAVLPKETPGVVEPPRNAVSNPVYGGGNTYDYGYCTWYVKNKRGSTIPNGLGDANTWYSRAIGFGMAIGPTPRAGAVGTTTRGALGHVVYVESVNKDGTINISEMNYKGWGVVSYRTASASEFLYIY